MTTPVAAPVAPTNTKAILAFVFAFVFWPAAIPLGHVARGEIKRTGEAGRGLATAGLVLSYIWLGLTALLVMVFLAAAASVGSSTPVPPVPVSMPAHSAQALSALQSDAIGDVEGRECAVDTYGTTAVLRVTNTTDATQSYLITTAIVDDGGTRIGEAVAAVNSLAPGKVAVTEGWSPAFSAGGQTCEVASVTRLPV